VWEDTPLQVDSTKKTIEIKCRPRARWISAELEDQAIEVWVIGHYLYIEENKQSSMDRTFKEGSSLVSSQKEYMGNTYLSLERFV